MRYHLSEAEDGQAQVHNRENPATHQLRNPVEAIANGKRWRPCSAALAK